MTARRRYLTFSLRTLFILLTLFAVWIGMVVRRATEQREAVEAIEALGGYVTYDWQVRPIPPSGITRTFQGRGTKRGSPAWLRQIVGDDYFQDVQIVSFFKAPSAEQSPAEADILKSLPYLRQLSKLTLIIVPGKTSRTTLEKLQAARPTCKIGVIGF